MRIWDAEPVRFTDNMCWAKICDLGERRQESRIEAKLYYCFIFLIVVSQQYVKELKGSRRVDRYIR